MSRLILPESMLVKLNGVEYDLQFTENLPAKYDGMCDPPDKKVRRRIRILRTLTGQELLETVIHELRHASHFYLSEEAVTIAARDEAKILWDLGLRFKPPTRKR